MDRFLGKIGHQKIKHIKNIINNDRPVKDGRVHNLQNTVVESAAFHELDLQAHHQHTGNQKPTGYKTLMFVHDNKNKRQPEDINAVIQRAHATFSLSLLYIKPLSPYQGKGFYVLD
jgi:hypothetical protein